MSIDIDAVDLSPSFPDMKVMVFQKLDRSIITTEFDEQADLSGQRVIPLSHDRMILGQDFEPPLRRDIGKIVELIQLAEKPGIRGIAGDSLFQARYGPREVVLESGEGQAEVSMSRGE
jgi:hypothetical protein